MLDVLHHPDHLHPGVFVQRSGITHALADWIGVGPILSRQGFIDDDDRWRGGTVLIRKGAAFQNHDSHRPKVFGSADSITAIVLLPGRRFRLTFDQKWI